MLESRNLKLSIGNFIAFRAEGLSEKAETNPASNLSGTWQFLIPYRDKIGKECYSQS